MNFTNTDELLKHHHPELKQNKWVNGIALVLLAGCVIVLAVIFGIQ